MIAMITMIIYARSNLQNNCKTSLLHLHILDIPPL